MKKICDGKVFKKHLAKSKLQSDGEVSQILETFLEIWVSCEHTEPRIKTQTDGRGNSRIA